jgi:hypothetical protein
MTKFDGSHYFLKDTLSYSVLLLVPIADRIEKWRNWPTAKKEFLAGAS